jgi:hypothetical protein
MAHRVILLSERYEGILTNIWCSAPDSNRRFLLGSGAEHLYTCTLEEVDFWIFNFLHFAIDGKNNSKTKVEKVFFFISMSSYAEMSFLKQKITK